ncbi:MAG: DUF1576 domain-containing protein [Synechocystis sp.]
MISPPSEQAKLNSLIIFALALIGFGFSQNSPGEIWRGLGAIMTAPDTLISDYIGIGGIGATFVNAGSLALIIALIIHRFQLPITGFTIACLFTVTGVGLFGKNLFNVWLIPLGVLIYAHRQKKPIKEVIYSALFGTALAPVTTEILFSTVASPWVTIPLGITVSLLIGFILIPVATNLFKVHQGFNLYNMGFTAGVVGIIFVSILNSYGIVPIPQMIWTTGNNRLFTVFLLSLLLAMLGMGCYWERNPWSTLKAICQYSGQLRTDFVELTGFGATLINMAVTGLIMTTYILLVGGDLNGPTIGGIFTVIGFAAFGKHPGNILPILGGIYLASLSKTVTANDAAMLLAALFGTTLAPIAGKYGWFWGATAGFIHSSAVQSVAVLHGGLNLYNNGFAAGIVAAVLIPVIEMAKEYKPKGNSGQNT